MLTQTLLPVESIVESMVSNFKQWTKYLSFPPQKCPSFVHIYSTAQRHEIFKQNTYNLKSKLTNIARTSNPSRVSPAHAYQAGKTHLRYLGNLPDLLAPVVKYTVLRGVCFGR